MTIRPGVRLGDRYQLLTPIATGGMGQVWRAEDTTLHRVVAAKVLRSEFTGDPTFLARFRTEAQNTAALSHPNIASVYDYGETVQDSERLAYLVMELVEGEPLVEILHKRRTLPVEQTLDVLQQAATGLDAAHRAGMVHRDIKPGNLIIRPDGVVKITDFGIARAANHVPLTDSGTVVGTAQYLAPEQAEGKPALPASDVYALGVVGYECLAGFRPFDGDNSVAIALSQIRDQPRPLPPETPPAVRDLIQHAMAKNPRMRLPNGGAFAAAVGSVRAGGGAVPPRPGAGLNPASQSLTAPTVAPGQPGPPGRPYAGAPGPGRPVAPPTAPPVGATAYRPANGGPSSQTGPHPNGGYPPATQGPATGLRGPAGPGPTGPTGPTGPASAATARPGAPSTFAGPHTQGAAPTPPGIDRRRAVLLVVLGVVVLLVVVAIVLVLLLQDDGDARGALGVVCTAGLTRASVLKARRTPGDDVPLSGRPNPRGATPTVDGDLWNEAGDD